MAIALTGRVQRAVRFSLGIVALAVLTATPTLHSDADAVRLVPAMQRYLDQTGGQSLATYRAFRRLEAEGMGHAGWLEAWTELQGNTFTYEVVGEGGSESVRRRVLHKYLENERHAIATGEAQRSALTPDNYNFQAAPEQAGGLIKILMKPRHKGKLMLDGAMFLASDAGSLVRVEGRAVSSPSFWIKRVQITRQYQRVNGINVPMAVASTASIRFAGTATFHMTYEYAQINGRSTFGTINTVASVGNGRD